MNEQQASIITTLLDKWEWWQVILLLGAIFYILCHLGVRKGEDGKKSWKNGFFWYSRREETYRQLIKDTFENFKDELVDASKKQEARALRLEIMFLMEHKPKNRTAIINCYKKYKELGGNFYIDEEFSKYCERENIGFENLK